MKRIFAGLLSAALCIGLAPRAGAVEVVSTIRVGLHYGSGALGEAVVENVDGAGFSVGTYNGRSFSATATTASTKLRVTASGESVTVTDANTGAAVYTGGGNVALSPNGVQFSLKSANYCGDAVFSASGSQLTAMNYVSLEDYVKGVLPYEMTPSWHSEALKAQAVFARSYALGSINKHQSRYGFDVCDGTDCQVYQGTGRATSNSNSAVDATRGEYLTHKGELATGFFFSSDGGATEDAVNVWGNEVGYLKGVPDPYEDLDNATNGRWTKTLTGTEIANKLRAAGYSIGTVSNVAITKRTPMDNVNEVTVTDTAGKKVTIRRQACRTVFSVNSIRYSINGQSGGSGASSGTSSGTSQTQQPAQPQTDVYITGNSALGPMPRFQVGAMAAVGEALQTILGASCVAATPSFTFAGTGWGHNVGMSQYGAKGMAEQGFDYRSILNYYFTDIQITK